jgi:hypothetical protein
MGVDIKQFLRYLLHHESSRDLAVQLAMVYETRLAPRP